MTTDVNVTLPSAIFLRNNAKGEAMKVDVTKLGEAVIAKIFEGGCKIILTNTYNGGGKERTDGEKEAQLLKRLDAWYRGEYAQVERGESQFTAMREQYYAEREKAAGQTRKQVDDAIKATVQAAFGEKEPATFTRFLDAVAQQKFNGMDRKAVEAFRVEQGMDAESIVSAHTVRDVIEAGLAKRTAEAAAERAKVAASLDMSGIDLGL